MTVDISKLGGHCYFTDFISKFWTCLLKGRKYTRPEVDILCPWHLHVAFEPSVHTSVHLSINHFQQVGYFLVLYMSGLFQVVVMVVAEEVVVVAAAVVDSEEGKHMF